MKLYIGARTHGLHESLIIPVAAKSKESIANYVGNIDHVFENNKGYVVSFQPLKPPNELGVWKHPRAYLLNYEKQVWVDISSYNYRKYYFDAFKENAFDKNHVVDHIMNRRLAFSLGYKFVRLIHIDRGINSDSGRGGETFSNYNYKISTSMKLELGINDIVYADPSDLVKMLNIKTGGKFIENVGLNHHLFY